MAARIFQRSKNAMPSGKAYAERSGIAYHVIPPTPRRLRIQSYADNFK